MMLWRLAAIVLPCQANFQLLYIPTSCPLCGDSEENSVCLFITCLLVHIFWRQSLWVIMSSTRNFRSPEEMVNYFLDPEKIAQRIGWDCKLFTFCAAILYIRMRCCRNAKLLDHTISNHSQAIELVMQDFMEHSNMFKKENMVELCKEVASLGVRTKFLDSSVELRVDVQCRWYMKG